MLFITCGSCCYILSYTLDYTHPSMTWISRSIKFHLHGWSLNLCSLSPLWSLSFLLSPLCLPISCSTVCQWDINTNWTKVMIWGKIRRSSYFWKLIWLTGSKHNVYCFPYFVSQAVSHYPSQVSMKSNLSQISICMCWKLNSYVTMKICILSQLLQLKLLSSLY